MANQDVNIAYLNDEEARTADMREMKEQIMKYETKLQRRT